MGSTCGVHEEDTARGTIELAGLVFQVLSGSGRLPPVGLLSSDNSLLQALVGIIQIRLRLANTQQPALGSSARSAQHVTDPLLQSPVNTSYNVLRPGSVEPRLLELSYQKGVGVKCI